MKKVYKLLLLFGLLNVLDYLTTMLALGHGAVEGNSITNIFVQHNALQYYKLVGVAFVCIYLIHAAKKDLKSQTRVITLLWWANLVYSLIAVSNVVAYFEG